MASDLSSIPGLQPKHEAVLAGPLRISTALELARADRRVVQAAMRRLRPAPTLEVIADWQDHARDLAAAARAGPEPAAAGRPGPGVAAGPQPASASRPARIPPAITVDTPELVLAAGTVHRLDAAGPAMDVPPRAVLKVTATSTPGLPLQAGLRLRRAGRPSYAPSPPVAVISGKSAEIDLDGLPPGEHDAVLAIWASHGQAAAAVIPLPRLCVPRRP